MTQNQTSRMAADSYTSYADLLDRLQVEPGDAVFVHSSLNRLQADVKAALTLIAAFEDRLGPSGTLFMPSYIWRGRSGAPLPGTVLDIRRTPSQVGLLTEVFRRSPGTTRSESYWVPVCGRGRLAEEVLADQAGVQHPFAADSTFGRLLSCNAKVIGLGVSLNTSSLSHLPDLALERFYPFRIFSEEPLVGKVISWDGSVKETSSCIVNSEIIVDYAPSLLIERSPILRSHVLKFCDGSTIFFSYSIKVYFEEALRMGQQCLQAGQLPPWVERITNESEVSRGSA